MRFAARTTLLAAAAGACAPALHAQTWRTIEASRQLHTDDSLRVRLEYAAGTLRLGAAAAPLLYDVQYRYDAQRVTPVRRFDAASRTLTIGIDEARAGWLRARLPGIPVGVQSDVKQISFLTLAVARAVPLDLSLDVDAAEADLDLSGLWLNRLRLQSGVSETRVNFGTPNPRPMRELTIVAGAAGMTVRRLGNANAGVVEIRSGAGSTDVDLTGEWSRDMDLRLQVALGAATLRLPRDLGVRLTVRQVLGSFDAGAAGLVERDGAYYSENWGTARRKLRIDAETTLGTLSVERGAH